MGWGGLALVSLFLFGCSGLDGNKSRSDARGDEYPPQGDPPSGGHDSGAGDDDAWLGELVIVDIPASDCTALEALCTEVYGRGEMTALHGLRRAGERWAAEAIWESGFVLFDENGENASPELITTGTLDRMAPSADDIHIATSEIEGVRARLYDLTGAPLGPAIELSDDHADEVAIGRAGADSLVVWTTPTRVAARGFSESGPSADVFELETDVWKDGFHAAIADSSGEEVAIAWSDRRVADSHYRTFFVRASTSGIRGLPRILIDDLEPHRVIDLRRTAAGYLLLLEQGGHPLVLPLTAFGDLAGPAYRYLGIQRVHGMAIGESGEEAVLAGLQEDGRDALRRLDAKGAPQGDWSCIHPFPSHGEHAVSVAPRGEGYSVLYRSVAAQELLYQLSADSLGGEP